MNKDLIASKKLRKKLKKAQSSLYSIGENTATSTSPTTATTSDAIAMDASIKKKKSVKKIEDTDPFKVRVHIHKVDSPDAIYVSDVSIKESFELMSHELNEFYETKRGQLDDDLKTEAFYCVYSRKDKQYCRAQFVKMEGELARMSLIDLMEEVEVALKDIQPLNPKFLTVSKYIFKVSLAGIRPCGGSNVWQASSCRKLNEIIQDTGDTKYYITLVVSSRKNL